MDDILEEEVAVDTEEAPGGNDGGGFSTKMPTTYYQMSELAAKQFAVIVGVALLAGGLYMLMIGIDMLTEKLEDVWYTYCGKKKVKDPEDPAALVGSFKRYK